MALAEEAAHDDHRVQSRCMDALNPSGSRRAVRLRLSSSAWEGETAHLVWFLATRGDSESKSEYFTGGSGMNGQLLTGDGSPVVPASRVQTRDGATSYMSMQGNEMRRPWRVTGLAMGLMIVGIVVGAYAMQGAKPASDPPASSYLSVNEESFPTVLARMRAAKDARSACTRGRATSG
jgi:hypothetical protein